MSWAQHQHSSWRRRRSIWPCGSWCAAAGGGAAVGGAAVSGAAVGGAEFAVQRSSRRAAVGSWSLSLQYSVVDTDNSKDPTWLEAFKGRLQREKMKVCTLVSSLPSALAVDTSLCSETLLRVDTHCTTISGQKNGCTICC